MNALLQAKPPVKARTSSPSQLTDEQLLLKYRTTKDRELFAALVDRYQRELYSYLRRYLGSNELAEDAFQSTFLQIHLKCDQFEEGRRLKPWLYAVATNQAIDVQRKDRRHRVMSLDKSAGGPQERDRSLVDLMVSQHPCPQTQARESERNEALLAALNELSEQMRTVVHLVYYQGLKYREAAEVMRIPVGTVKSRLHTAVAKLAEFWNRNYAEID
jgi:RNA polymerase sigma-70 factor, ECF subfamily